MILRRLSPVLLAVALPVLRLSAGTPDYGYAGRIGNDPVEGVWRMTDDGAVFAITATPGMTGTFDITLVDSPDFSLTPGLCMGRAKATARPGVYDATIVSDPTRPDPAKIFKGSRDCTITITEEARLELRPYSRSKKISLRRWLPYLFRVSVVENATRPDNLDGALRIYPPAPYSTPTVL